MGSRLSPAEEVFVNIFTTLYGEQHRSYLLKYHNLPFVCSNLEKILNLSSLHPLQCGAMAPMMLPVGQQHGENE